MPDPAQQQTWDDKVEKIRKALEQINTAVGEIAQAQQVIRDETETPPGGPGNVTNEQRFNQ
jgi:uncharacterized protein YukE